MCLNFTPLTSPESNIPQEIRPSREILLILIFLKPILLGELDCGVGQNKERHWNERSCSSCTDVTVESVPGTRN